MIGNPKNQFNSPLGTAVGFPLRPNGRGGLVVVSGAAAVEDSIRAIIESLKGSHLFEPWLGLPSFIFKPVPDPGAVAEVIREAIVNGDDRVDTRSIAVQTDIGDSGLMPVTIVYSIRGDSTVRTLQHGFRAI